MVATDPGSVCGWRASLQAGLVIPACPLALTAERRFDERHQRALVRYYRAAGAGGLAVGVHTTQFAIRDPAIGLHRPVLEVAMEELRRPGVPGGAEAVPRPVCIAGLCGSTRQAVREAELARALGYDAGLLSLGALREATEAALLEHCHAVGEVMPLVGFYLQPAVGGRVLDASFWRRFAEIPSVVAIKIAPFNRYQTLDVVRAVIAAGRSDIALYTGNDDAIVADLLTPFRFPVEAEGRSVERRIVGGLLGHWAVWTRAAVDWHARCRAAGGEGQALDPSLLRLGVEVTDANAAVFDAAHGFAGCIPGIHEVLRRQGLLSGIECLDPSETLSRGQAAELDRVTRAYPHLVDDDFVRDHLATWLS